MCVFSLFVHEFCVYEKSVIEVVVVWVPCLFYFVARPVGQGHLVFCLMLYRVVGI